MKIATKCCHKYPAQEVKFIQLLEEYGLETAKSMNDYGLSPEERDKAYKEAERLQRKLLTSYSAALTALTQAERSAELIEKEKEEAKNAFMKKCFYEKIRPIKQHKDT